MAIYVFNLLVRYVPNGVDNAQGRRAKYLKQLNTLVKYVYTDLPNDTYIKRYTDTGIDYSDMICTYLKLAGNEYIGSGDIIEKAIYSNEKMVACEYYSNRLLYTHFYMNQNGKNCLSKTTIYTSEGQVAFDVIYRDEIPESFMFPNGEICSQYEFFVKCFKRMDFKEDDVILIDRPGHLNYIQALFENKGKAKTIVFLHSAHYFEHHEDQYYNYVNPEYYYWFGNLDAIDSVVVSTEYQKQELIHMLKMYNQNIPNIVVIPACGISNIRQAEHRKTYSIISVARHDERKRLDLSILSVIEAHKTIPEISLDIYGRGDIDYTEYLQRIIKENDAQDYINLKGYRNVTDIYEQYELFLTTSSWETLGLGLMEAVAAGNAVVGFDAVYGNKELIRDGYNGIRIPIDYDQMNAAGYVGQLVQNVSDAIVDMFSDSDKLTLYQNHSYEVAKEYLDEKIASKWIDFLERESTT